VLPGLGLDEGVVTAPPHAAATIAVIVSTLAALALALTIDLDPLITALFSLPASSEAPPS
jgi:hypothetical protein